MKKHILFLLILFSNNIWAQYESVFGTETTSWHLFQELSDGFDTDSIFIVKDTIINELSYKTVSNPYGELWFLREAEDNSKVFFYSPNRNDSEYIVLDLTLQKSDTLLIGVNNTDTLLVDSVYTIDNMKHIRFNYLIEFAGGSEYLEFIEGVGTNFGLFYQGIDPMYIAQRHYLLCSYKNAGLYYTNSSEYFSGQCEVVWTGIPNLNESNNPKVFPNPARETINFQLDDYWGNVVLHIFDSKGSLIKKVQEITNLMVVNLTDFPPGLYFYSLQSDKQIINNKFIITK